MTNSIQTKMANFVLEFPQYEGISIEELVSIMLETGHVSLRDLQEVSAFGMQIRRDLNRGVTVERLAPNENSEVVEGYEYETSEGIKVKEIYSGEDLVEKIIYKKDDNGDEVRTSFYYTDGKLVKVVRAKNGNITSSTEYNYVAGGENGVDIVTLTTKKSDGSTEVVNALEVDEIGNVKEEDFLDRTVTLLSGVEKNIYKENGFLYESIVNPDGSTVLTIYNGSDLMSYEAGELHKYYQEYQHNGKITPVEYDGEGNTKIVVQNGEGKRLIAERFGITIDELLAANPELNRNTVLIVGQTLVIPKEVDATERVFNNRLDREGAMQAYAQDESERLSQSLMASKLEKITLDKDYANVYEFAKESLIRQGIANPTTAQVNTRANELIMLNGRIQYKKGVEVSNVAKTLSSEHIQELTEIGFAPSPENMDLYFGFNDLSESDKKRFLEALSASVTHYREMAARWESANIPSDYIDKVFVLNDVKRNTNIDVGCEDKKIFTAPIKKGVLPGMQQIMLEQSRDASGNPVYKQVVLRDYCPVPLEYISIESFVRHVCGFEGEQADELIYRLKLNTPEALERFDITSILAQPKESINMFSVKNAMATSLLRWFSPTEVEYERTRPRTEREIATMKRGLAVECVENMFDNVIAQLQNYQDSQGIFNIGFWREQLGKVVDATGLIDAPATFEELISRVQTMKFIVSNALNSNKSNERGFAEKFREYMGVEYNQENFDRLFDAIEAQSDNVQELFEKAVGTQYLDAAEKTISRQSFWDGAGDIGVMLITLGASAEFKAVQAFSKGVTTSVGRVVTNRAAAGVLSRGITSGTMLAGYTALTGTTNLLTNNRSETLQDWQDLGTATAGSFGFGFVGGAMANKFHALNQTVSKFASRCLPKVFVNNSTLQAVKNVLPNMGNSMSGVDFMEKYMVNAAKGNIVGDAAQFVGEVLTFAGYEISIDVASDIANYLFDESGEFKSHLDEMSITEYIAEKVGAQVEMLGTIKGVSAFMQMIMGSKMHGAMAMRERLNEVEILRDTQIRTVDINGVQKYVLENGKERFVVDNPTDIPLMFQNIIAIHNLNKIYEAKLGETENKAETFNVEEYKRNNPLDVEHIRNTYEPNVAELFERCYEIHPDFVVEILKSKECDLSNINAWAISDVNENIAKLLVCATEHPEMVSYMKELYSEGYNFSRITSKTRAFVAQKRELNNRLTTNEIYTTEDVRDLTRVIENRPELKSDILDCASKKMTYRQTMEEINRLDARRLELRTSLEEKYPEQMAQLKTTLGEEFFSQVKWEKHILSDFSEAQAFEALTELNNSAKFFARTTTNEQRYGKNFVWARSMNEISTHAQEAIRSGKTGAEVLDLIAQEYGDFDRAGGVSGRENSGKVRQLDHRGEGRMFRTPFDNLECYPEYFDRFVERDMVPRKRPYNDIGLTSLYSHEGETSGTMVHPTSDLVQPCLRHVERIHNEMQPLFDKVTRGETLTEAEITTAHSKISEIYFLLGNTAPYERGSNGIADIYMRSMYEALKIDMPALKRNVSLDLEAFCMDLPEYQSKWLTFFEGKPEVRVNSPEVRTGERTPINQSVDFVHNFDLRPENFREFLLGLKNANGESLYKSENMDAFFSHYSSADIALRFDLVKRMVEESKGTRLLINDGIEGVLGLSNSSLKTLQELFEIPQGQEGSFIDCKTLIATNRFMDMQVQSISKLIQVAKETNNPLLNRTNIIHLSKSSLATETDLLVKALKVKDANGNFVLDKSLIKVLEQECDIPSLLEKFIALDGTKSAEMFREILSVIGSDANIGLHSYLMKNVLDNKLTKPEQINDFVDSYFNDYISHETGSAADFQCNFKTSEFNWLFRELRLQYPLQQLKSIHSAFEKYEMLLEKPEHKPFIEMLKNKGLLDFCDMSNDFFVLAEEQLQKFTNIVDAYASLKGFGEVVKNGDVMSYYEQLKKSNPRLAEELEREGFYYKQDGSKFEEATIPMRDIIESARVERLKGIFETDLYSAEIKDFLYEEYLNTFPCEDVYKNKCREINRKYGVKVIMGAYKEVEALDFVREELQAFRDASGGTAKLIDVFDFTMSSYADYVNPEGAHGMGAAGGYQKSHRIGTQSMRFSSVAHALRHELMHANDLKLGVDIDPKYNWDEIAVKNSDGKFDLSKCKYVDDFRRIGIPEWHIAYAYNNTKEFIAVAAEGDLTKCTPEFKQVLIDFGMPEWMFRIRSHEMAKQQARVSFETLCTECLEGWEITPEGQRIIEAQVEQVRTNAAKSLYDDVQFMYDFGLGNPRSLTYRTKSSTSMFDKVKNYLFDNANNAPSLADAMLDIRDANGFRTTIENVDYSSHPEVKTLLDAGDKHGAALRAAELQSQPYVDRLIGVMTAFAEGRTNKKPTRISNYMGADGVPYFSERQLREIQLHAERCGINLSIVTEFDVRNNSHFTPEEMSAYSKGRTTKVREAGYTALQVNFENADGTIFEWQLRGKEVDFFAEREHLPYDLRTNKDITGGNPEVSVLVEDVKNLLKEDNIKPEDYAEYNNYLTAHYRHLRYVELGIPSEAPKLPAKFDARLKVENLDLLHHYVVQVKDGKMTGAEALAEYTRMLR